MFNEIHRYYGKRKTWLFLGRISRKKVETEGDLVSKIFVDISIK